MLHQNKGFTLIEVLVFSGLTTIVFIGIFIGFRFALELTAQARAQSAALSLASGQMEFIRSLEYDQIGTQGGIPAGPIPQLATTVLGGVEFTTRTLIYWVDDPADGLGADDVNGITTDYKEAKVEVIWESRNGSPQSLFLLSRFTPTGIESNVSGGNIRIEVYDRDFAPLSGVSVQLQNETTTSTIDVTQNTNVNGFALFPGAPAASQYEVLLSRLGYSNAQTYRPSSSLPNPSTQPFTVVEGETTVLSFRIDQVSDFLIRTLAPTVSTVVEDEFSPPTTVTTTDAVLVDEAYRLAFHDTEYVATGTVQSSIVSPSTIARWDMASFTASTSFETSVRLQVVEPVGTTSVALLPNADLPGNSFGFTSGFVDLSQLDVTHYPELGLLVTLETSSSTQTPALESWSLAYVSSEVPQSDVPLRVRGTKTIGTDSEGASVYKYDSVHTSDSGGDISLLEMEWDTYHIEPQAGWAIVSTCPAVPFDLDPGVAAEVRVHVLPDATPSLRVQIMSGEVLIPGATVVLTRSGLEMVGTTDTCGQVFFSDSIVNEDDYSIQVTASGFVEEVVENVSVDGASTLIISISP